MVTREYIDESRWYVIFGSARESRSRRLMHCHNWQLNVVRRTLWWWAHGLVCLFTKKNCDIFLLILRGLYIPNWVDVMTKRGRWIRNRMRVSNIAKCHPLVSGASRFAAQLRSRYRCRASRFTCLMEWSALFRDRNGSLSFLLSASQREMENEIGKRGTWFQGADGRWPYEKRIDEDHIAIECFHSFILVRSIYTNGDFVVFLFLIQCSKRKSRDRPKLSRPVGEKWPSRKRRRRRAGNE